MIHLVQSTLSRRRRAHLHCRTSAVPIRSLVQAASFPQGLAVSTLLSKLNYLSKLVWLLPSRRGNYPLSRSPLVKRQNPGCLHIDRPWNCHLHGDQRQATRPVLRAGNRASVVKTVTAHQPFVVVSKVLAIPVRQEPRSPDKKQINSANGSAPCSKQLCIQGGRVPQVGPQ